MSRRLLAFALPSVPFRGVHALMFVVFPFQGTAKQTEEESLPPSGVQPEGKEVQQLKGQSKASIIVPFGQTKGYGNNNVCIKIDKVPIQFNKLIAYNF